MDKQNVEGTEFHKHNFLSYLKIAPKDDVTLP